MAVSKNVQYIVTALLVLYIVFYTRPAPTPVVQFLASPVAQLAALGGVVYLGASVSLLIAVVLAIALVLSIPPREHFEAKKEKKKDEAAATPPPAAAGTSGKSADESVPAGSDHKKKKATATSMSSDSSAIPVPAGDKALPSASTSEAKGSEKFTLENAAPF